MRNQDKRDLRASQGSYIDTGAVHTAVAAVPADGLIGEYTTVSRTCSGALAFAGLRYALALCFVCLCSLAISRQASWDHTTTVAIFLCVALASELLPVTLSEGNLEITLTPVVAWAVVALFGPGYGSVFVFCAALFGSLLSKKVFAPRGEHREDFWQFLLYNSFCIGAYSTAGALIYQALGGPMLIGVRLDTFALHTLVVPLIAATLLSQAMEMTLFAVGAAVADVRHEDEVSLDSIWMRAKVMLRKNIPGFLPSYLMFTPFAYVLAYLFVWNGLGFWGVLPILVPFFSVRHALKVVMDSIKAYRHTTTTLATLMQKYHPYTRGHLKRVADLSLRLARELRLPASSQQWIWEAGLLHDIGKLGVSEEILDKSGRLTPDEWETIRGHPVKSADILGQMEFLDTIVPWVRHHHERFDGRGYPDGLEGDRIPLEAAIIAVADAFDAMTGKRGVGRSHTQRQCDACGWKAEPQSEVSDACPGCGATLYRVYREPLSSEEGINQLRYGVGGQFSPRVVRGFIQMMKREEAMNA